MRPSSAARSFLFPPSRFSASPIINQTAAPSPLGERPVGYIFYNHDGYMSVEIMAEGRVPYQEPDVFGGTPQERSGRSAHISRTRAPSSYSSTGTP